MNIDYESVPFTFELGSLTISDYLEISPVTDLITFLRFHYCKDCHEGLLRNIIQLVLTVPYKQNMDGIMEALETKKSNTILEYLQANVTNKIMLYNFQYKSLDKILDLYFQTNNPTASTNILQWLLFTKVESKEGFSNQLKMIQNLLTKKYYEEIIGLQCYHVENEVDYTKFTRIIGNVKV